MRAIVLVFLLVNTWSGSYECDGGYVRVDTLGVPSASPTAEGMKHPCRLGVELKDTI